MGFCFGQTANPGNVGTGNLTAWFTPANLANGNVTNWTTTFPILPFSQISVTDNSAPYPIATETPANATSNYNRTIQFSNPNGINQALTNNANINLLSNSNANDQGTFFMAFFIPAPKVNGHMLLYNNGSAGIQFRNLGSITRLAISNGFGDTPNGCKERQEDFLPTIVSYEGNRSGGNSMKGFDKGGILPVGVASQSTGSAGLYFGCYAGDNGSGYTGFIHEAIFYNRDLTLPEISRVHTYLAIKYGITLDNSGGGTYGDYANTNGTLVWDASINAGYHNDVIGLGRDTRQSLLQKQSHSFDDQMRIYIDTLRTTNLGNSGTFLSDTSYVIIGHNNANTCNNTASASEAPSGISARLAREWKVTKSNFSQDFHLDLAIDTCNNPGFSIGTVDFGQLKLLVDADGDFSNAQVFDQTNGLIFSMVNDYITVRNIGNIHLPDNATRYITLAYNSPQVTLAGPDSLCQGESAWYYWNVLNVPGPVNFSYSDGSSTYNLTNIQTGDSIQFTPTTSTTITVFNDPNFITCCGGNTNTSFTIYMGVSTQIVANATDTLVCLGDSVLIYGSGAQSYTWSNGAPDSSYITISSNSNLYVTGIDAEGCSGTDSISIYINSSVNFMALASDTILCYGDSTKVYGVGGSNYSWTGGIQDNVDFVPQQSQTYYLTGNGDSGCTEIDSVFIMVVPPLNVLANTNTAEICDGDSVLLYGSGATTYQWYPTVVDSVYFQPTSSSWYMVMGSDGYGCSDTDSLFIVLNPSPNVTANASANEICSGESILLFGAGANSYNWNSGVVNNATFQPLSSGFFTVVGSTPEGCSDTDSIFIIVHARPTVMANSSDTTVCRGDSTLVFGSGAQTYAWNNGVQNSLSFQPTLSQLYTVIGTDMNGCMDTSTIYITVNEINPLYLGPDTVLCEGDELTLSTMSAYAEYNWNTGAITPTIVVNQQGTYLLETRDENGCFASDSIRILIRFDCDTVDFDPLIFVPNAFTPDGNIYNNLFRAVTNDLEEFRMTIYNRWGEVIYETSDPLQGWDGTYGGKLVPSGMYVYKINYRGFREFADPQEIHGTFHLLR